jgi:DNA-directed RNA polymerase sigma subunit (sigma70/sigma32)
MSESDTNSAHDHTQTGMPVELLSPQTEQATQATLKDKIEQVLKTLTHREREIIELRYGLAAC